MSLKDLVQVSQRYGSDPEWVLAGGGNTSLKHDTTLWIKASGFPLATIEESGFATMDRRRLQAIWNSTYPSNPDEREAAALAELMAARTEGEEKRPSVETLMHELFPFSLVVHTHPALANGITCAHQGQLYASRLFGSRVLWIPAIEPGYILATEMRRLANEHAERVGSFPQIVLLQNHGLVVAADTVSEINKLHATVRRTITGHVKRKPEMKDDSAEYAAAADRWSATIELAFAMDVYLSFFTSPELRTRLESRTSFEPFALAYSPDHIVYAGAEPLFVPAGALSTASGIRGLLDEFRARTGKRPRILAIEGLGAFGVDVTKTGAQKAAALFNDEVRIAAYAESFGGVRPLDQHLIEFIDGWEVERYRKNTSGVSQ